MHLAQLREQQAVLEALGVVVVVVSFEPPERMAAFQRNEALPYAVHSDAPRNWYRAFGLASAGRRRLFGLRTIAAYITGALQGHWYRPATGDIAQLGGDFIVDRRGRVVFSHRSVDPADRPAVTTLLDAFRRLSTPSRW